jgi:hypothetical protein
VFGSYTRPDVLFSETLYLHVFHAGASMELSAPWLEAIRTSQELSREGHSWWEEGGNSSTPLLPTQPARSGPMHARRTWYHHETNLLPCCVVYTADNHNTIHATAYLTHPHPSLFTSARELHRLHRDSTPHLTAG